MRVVKEDVISSRIEKLQEEYNKIISCMNDLKNQICDLDGRRIQLEGTLKELIEIKSLEMIEIGDEVDTEGNTSEGSGADKG